MNGARRPPRLLLVTGMSGAGKSTVLDALEDMGWDCVENLPALMLKPDAYWDQAVIRLWPSDGFPVSWPPPKYLNDERIKEFINRFTVPIKI